MLTAAMCCSRAWPRSSREMRDVVVAEFFVRLPVILFRLAGDFGVAVRSRIVERLDVE